MRPKAFVKLRVTNAPRERRRFISSGQHPLGGRDRARASPPQPFDQLVDALVQQSFLHHHFVDQPQPLPLGGRDRLAAQNQPAGDCRADQGLNPGDPSPTRGSPACLRRDSIAPPAGARRRPRLQISGPSTDL